MALLDDLRWQDSSLCSRTSRFEPFPAAIDKEQIAFNKAVCKQCHVRKDCFAYAWTHHEDDGFYAGMFYNQRVMVAAILNIPQSISPHDLLGRLSELW